MTRAAAAARGAAVEFISNQASGAAERSHTGEREGGSERERERETSHLKRNSYIFQFSREKG